MLFNSSEFLFGFLPVVFIVFLLLGQFKNKYFATGWLAIASILFYVWDDPVRLLPIIVASVSVNYSLGCLLGRRRSPWVLTIGIFANLILLGWYKYAAFLLTVLVKVTDTPIPVPAIVLPIGISFFTFTQIAFLVDSYRGEAREYNPLHYCLFVTFFPHLIAGPIIHHKEIMPQFARDDTYQFSLGNFNLGIGWFSLGLIKKVLLADSVAPYASNVFSSADQGNTLSFADAWLGVLSYTLQIYFDFSGYSDMAIGLALIFGIVFPLNFNSPYKATSLIDFWTRWHMTLSRFLRDYLYFPLGGNRKGSTRRYFNLMITMLLGGLWHGAAWTFIIWGGLHGLGLIVNHAWRAVSRPNGWMLPLPLCNFLTLGFVTMAWVPFRAADFDGMLRLWKSMINLRGLSGSFGESSVSTWQVGWIAALLAIALLTPNTQELIEGSALRSLRPSSRIRFVGWTILTGTAFGIAVSLIVYRHPSEFLYFKF